MTVLVVDLARVLDESAPGRRGAATLQARFDELKSQHDKLKSRGSTERGKQQADAAAAAFEVESGPVLAAERVRLRNEVLALCRPLIAAVMQEKKADVVVDATAVLASSSSVDVTDEIIKRLG